MVGVLAMAATAAAPPRAPGKDLDIQPCKKQRKEDDGASCKTITEYMSPIRKTGDKVFSPPKSNNILDYFKRTSPINEKPSVAKECKIQSSKPLHVDDSKEWKILLNNPSNLEPKSRGKKINLSQQLNDIKKLENEPIIISSDDSREEASLHNVSVGSENDTSASLTLKNVESISEGSHSNKKQSSTVSSLKDRKKVNSERSITKSHSKKLRKRKHKDDKDLTRSLSLEKESGQRSKKQPSDNEQAARWKTGEVVDPVSDSSPGICVSETAQVNDNTVTVSYEEFLRSQEENPLECIQGPKMSARSHSDSANEVGKSGNTSDLETSESSQHLPLKTVTVLAQIHAVPPKPLSRIKGKRTLKIPSIFLKQKESEIGNNLPEPENEQTVQKRKSNVVIAEEELELAVIDAGGPESTKPKCTMEERQQFMNAFRQPAFDAVKSGVKKSLERQKDAQEKSLKEEGGKDDSVKGTECAKMPKDSNNDSSQPCDPKGSPAKGKRKKLRKKHKRILATEDAAKEENTSCDVNIKQRPNSIRRSLRQQKTEASKSALSLSITSAISEDVSGHRPLHVSTPKASRKSSRKITTSVKSVGITYPKDVLDDSLGYDFTPKSTRKSSQKTMVMIGDTDSEDTQVDGPGKVSTKAAASTSLEQHGLYMAELITVPFDSKSPIRMKFTRISSPPKSKKTETDDDFTPKSRKASSVSKNISKAKQLIEKAKAIQQSKSKMNEEGSAPLRRSSRQQVLTERKKLSEIDSAENKQKEIQCLNDVLGKKTNKTTKDLHGKIKVAPLFLLKKPQKTAEPIVIFDDNSQDVSENSQDDEQFKAKREFLMSGLPDSLKRHIAKKAAALEVYSSINSCFQRVVHIQQRDNGNPLWCLIPPSCPLLTDLKDPNSSVTNVTKHVIALGEFSALNSRPSTNNSTVGLLGARKDFTEEIKKILLEEIRWSNPQFPLKRFFTQFLKKRIEHQALFGCQNKQGHPQIKSIDGQREAKRKRGESENHKSKRRKPGECDEDLMAKDFPEGKREARPGQCSRTSKKKHGASGSVTCREAKSPGQGSEVVIIEEEKTFPSEGPSSTESGIEDVLWTEKYQPQDSSELIDNEIAIQKLHSWLKDWKRRAEWEEKGNLRVRSDDKEQDLSFSMDFKDISDDEEENSLCNTVLIMGPPGVGKTAAVYACAQELGFKIFEVNASSQRSGRQILSQLKEATQSHQVDKQGVNSHKPCFFNNYSVGRSPKKLNSPKKVLTSPRKPPLSPRVAKRGLPPKTSANYFKVSSKQSNNEVMKPQKNNKEIISSEEKQDTQTKWTNISSSNVKELGAEESSRKNATSLILFEEVDVIFDEDAGFLNAIKTFMATTKRPVILTTSDPTFSLTFDGCFQEINFKTPSLLNVASYLQTLCLAENLRTDVKDFITLLTVNNCDIRRSILYLQFWVRSGGGFLKEKPLSLHGESEGNAELICSQTDACPKNRPHTHKDPADLPKCDIGCAESLLGVKNIVLPSEDLFSFIKHKITTREEWNKLIQLLTEFQKQNVDFLYNNLEFILPLPVHIIPESKDLGILPETLSAPPPRKNENPLNTEHSEEGSSLAKTKKMRRRKKMIVLDDSDLFDTSLNYSDEGVGLLSAIPPSSSEESSSALKLSAKGKKKKPLESNIFVSLPPETLDQQKCPALVSHCLNSLTEFMDNMSFLDSLLPDLREQKEFGKNEDFNWTNGKVKNGLCDEFSQKPSDGWTCQGSEELKAVVEALSFTKCSSMISKVLESSLNPCKKLGKDLTRDLTLYISEQRNNVYFSQSAADVDKAQKRLAVVKAVFSGKSLLNLGSSRQASLSEYLPALRSICRMEKLKEQERNKRRFLHYFEGIHLDIPKDTVSRLAAEFP
ncbi:ATPase family AAA domain-containing protein 5 isoform X2 [Phascolarctos cinereus]|uniref:ATPase family AAA domain-containing protein 5 n=1 Tax=Phascolarctos cinereus TaxID=38626 RepID=A0A6P5IAC2_PHACI|nr:ATPase family AAA domain-containing protein 5 isoform X2 [Phascolarctos cinereus]